MVQRILLFLSVLLVAVPTALCQEKLPTTKHNKHQFYVYWGWNREWFTKSDIHFHGGNYDFKLAKVVAHDRQTPIAFDPYLNPESITVPQTNVRIGFFLSDHWSVSAGLDHMKYVMDTDQVVPITGYIQNTNTVYDGVYHGDNIQLKTDFLKFEHTNGLNYINAAVRRHDQLVNLKQFHLPNIAVNLTEGLEAGILLPRTDATLLNYNRHDEFHLAGYGLSAQVGINIMFFNHFFFQSEWKGGYCNMPDIRTTEFATDRADQHFFYHQVNFLVGAQFGLGF